MQPLRLHPIAALDDNYIWLLADDRGRALVVDPGDAAPVLAFLARQRLRLTAILLTHHHPDHIAGVGELMRLGGVDVYAPRDERIPVASQRVDDGEQIEIAAPACRFNVIAVPGHTRSHVAYFGHEMLFCGDTMFSVGCGRLFEGTPAEMLGSLERLATLPGNTRVCCGHEYTAANCRFALSVDPDNAELRDRAERASALRAAGRPTLPSLLSEEISCNPFLRIDRPPIRESMEYVAGAGADRVARFAALRRLKDAYRA